MQDVIAVLNEMEQQTAPKNSCSALYVVVW